MKNIILGLSLALVAVSGLSVTKTAEARNNDRYHRVYISPHDVFYIRGVAHHRHHRGPIHVVRDRRGYPVSYYYVDTRRDRYDYRHDGRRHQHRDDYRYRNRDRYGDREGITIIYRN